ncbi:MAG: 1,4-dihydroxy-2-naphthoate octaprenyltransferase [Proteobacteria bacterium]|nr:1,4-dihydroxy-2-naphthoate octaprenyltransferase [Pseudomonadota bacterium]
MSGISLWWRAVRPFAFTVSLIPPIMGGILALIENPDLDFNAFRFILAGIGCMVAHAGANLLSDYYDFKRRVDRKGTFGSSGLLVEEIMRPGQILKGGWVALLIAGAIGAYLIIVTPGGLFLLWLIFIGGIFGVFYTAGPIQFKYRAWGDLAVFISFGPAMVLGAYYVQAHHFSWGAVLYALPMALLVDAILHANNLRDIENDSAVNIKTVPILVGEKWAQAMYYGLILGAYLLTLILILFAGLPAFALITLVSLPLAIKVTNLVRHKKEAPLKQFAMIDAATAQLHLAFGLLMIIAFLLHYFIVM